MALCGLPTGCAYQSPRQLVEFVADEWGQPAALICDRFRESELRDASKGISALNPVLQDGRKLASDIRDLRRLAKDGPLSCEELSRQLVASGLAVATVKSR